MVDNTCLRVYQRSSTKYFLLLLMVGLNTTVMRAQDAPKKKYDTAWGGMDHIAG